MGEIKKSLALCIAVIFIISMNAGTAAAAGKKLQLAGNVTASAGSTYTLVVTPKPKVYNLPISLYLLTLGSTKFVKTVKTDSYGKAKFTFTASKSKMTLEARASGYSSSRLKVSILKSTKVSVSWPDTENPYTCRDMYARVSVTPKSSGRKVVSQFLSNDGAWVSEFEAYSNSNGMAYVKIGESSSGGNYKIRIKVHGNAKYSAITKSVVRYFVPCRGTMDGNIVDTTLDWWDSQPLQVNWQSSNWDPDSWDGEDASVYLEVCDTYYYECDPSDPEMEYSYTDNVQTFSANDYGMFSWVPDEYGTYVVRISLWDNYEMLYYLYDEITVE